jgi:hypothetical protein
MLTGTNNAVIARSMATKQSRNYDEIAALPPVARNDKCLLPYRLTKHCSLYPQQVGAALNRECVAHECAPTEMLGMTKFKVQMPNECQCSKKQFPHLDFVIHLNSLDFDI